MRKEEVKNGLAERFGEQNGHWLWRCITASPFGCEDQAERYARIWRKSKSIDEFLHEVHEDDCLRYFHAWGEIGKAMNWDIPVSNDARVFYTGSDAGGLLVGDVNGGFSYLIPNGYGDGETRVVVADRMGLFNEDMMRNVGIVDGNTLIYGYDCSTPSQADNDALVLHGRYSVFSYDGTVAFRKMK